ncbi:MAG: ATP cone domain-containing protein [Clostridiaceae bacterium]
MNVIKRDGRIQEFDIKKVRTSFQNASDDAKMPFTKSDIDVLVENVEDNLNKTDIKIISVKEIQEASYNAMIESGFKTVAKFYKSYEGNKLD